jgi:hypothetical protein
MTMTEFDRGWAAGMTEAAAWIEDAIDRMPRDSMEAAWARGAVGYFKQLVADREHARLAADYDHHP